MNNISSAHSDGHDSFVLLRGKEQTSWTVRLLHVLTAQLDVVLKKMWVYRKSHHGTQDEKQILNSKYETVQ